MPKRLIPHIEIVNEDVSSGVTPAPPTNRPEDFSKEDLRASMRVLGWLNETLDAAAATLGARGTRSMAMTLLILHKNPRGVSGKKLTRLYAAWNAAEPSPKLEAEIIAIQSALLRRDLAQVGRINGVAISTAKFGDLQRSIGLILDQPMQSIHEIQLTKLGKDRVEAIREVIEKRLTLIRKNLQGSQRRLFDRMIKQSLPLSREN